MVSHHQEPAVEDTLFADEHGRHRRLHVVVDATLWHAAEEAEAARMRIEQHLLGLARIGPDVHRPRCAQPHMGDLHPHRLARDLDVLMAPVELVRLARHEQERDERRHAVTRILAPCCRPARRITPDRIVGALEPFAQQQIVDTRHPQPVAPMPRFVLYQQRIEPFLKRPDPRQRLHRAMIIERAFRRSDRLAHDLPRQPKITRNRLDRLTPGVLAPNPNHCLHHQHPDLATWKTRQLLKPSN